MQKSVLQTIENYVAIQSHFFINFNLKLVSKTGRKAVQNGYGRLRCLQDAPRRCQKASRKLPRGPKTASRGGKSLHGHLKLPDASKISTNYAPRGLPDAPKPLLKPSPPTKVFFLHRLLSRNMCEQNDRVPLPENYRMTRTHTRIWTRPCTR